MTVVLDEFVIQFGLDHKQFEEDRRTLDQEIDKAKESAISFGKTVEQQGVKISEAFGFFKRGAVGVLATFVGGEAAAFIEHVATMDAHTNRLARSLAMATKELSVWQNVITAVGGQAGDADALFAGINDAFMNFSMGMAMPSSPLNRLMGSAGVDYHRDSPDAALRKFMQFLVPRSEHDQRQWLMQIPGMNEGALLGIMDLMRDPEKMRNLEETFKKLAPTREQIRLVEEYQAKSAELNASLKNLAREGFPVLTTIINGLTAAMQAMFGSKDQTPTREQLSPNLPIIEPGSILDRYFNYYTGRGFVATSQGDAGPTGGIGLLSVGANRNATRGDRNNNPGNIEYGPWAKAHGATGSDGRFAIFPDWDTGAQAMSVLLHDKYSGLTLSGIEQKWVGNSDPAYLRKMMAETGLGANDVPNLNSMITMKALIRGMMRGEGTRIPTSNTQGKQSSVTIHGGVNVTSSNADPKAVANEIPEAIKRSSLLAGANTGLV
jgi:hypothetical protein